MQRTPTLDPGRQAAATAEPITLTQSAVTAALQGGCCPHLKFQALQWEDGCGSPQSLPKSQAFPCYG